MQIAVASDPCASPVPLSGTVSAITPPKSGGDRGRRRTPVPDLSALSRGAASFIEHLATLARLQLATSITDVGRIVAKAQPGSHWHLSRKQELEQLRHNLNRAEAFQKGARRRRMARVTPAERDALQQAREANPDIGGSALEAILLAVPEDPLDVAAAELDAAQVDLNVAPRTSEVAFGQAEARWQKAHAAYTELIEERLGHSVNDILRRLA